MTHTFCAKYWEEIRVMMQKIFLKRQFLMEQLYENQMYFFFTFTNSAAVLIQTRLISIFFNFSLTKCNENALCIQTHLKNKERLLRFKKN